MADSSSAPSRVLNEQSAAALITAENLQYFYAGSSTPALQDINLSISAGSCFGLLGPNGAGKTTLISLLTGLIELDQGQIQIAQYNLPAQREAIKRISALVPQEYAFYPALTGRENLQFFAGLFQIPATQVVSRLEYCISVCGLERVLDQRSSNYSGGIKRRLNLALGLLGDPKILYLDEPTVGIDAQSRHFILRAIQDLSARGITIIYTSHYMEEVEQICDHAAIIDGGRVLVQGSMRNLLCGGRQLRIVPASVPSPGQLDALAALVKSSWDGSCLAIETSDQQSLSHVLGQVEQSGIVIDKLNMGSSRLEEVYLNATHPQLRL